MVIFLPDSQQETIFATYKRAGPYPAYDYTLSIKLKKTYKFEIGYLPKCYPFMLRFKLFYQKRALYDRMIKQNERMKVTKGQLPNMDLPLSVNKHLKQSILKGTSLTDVYLS